MEKIMSEQQYRFVLEAKSRDDQGKGASRRLRRAGFVPAIVYGGSEQPLSISLSQNDLVKFGQQDGFYSQIILLKVAGLPDQEVLVRDVQRHLFKPLYQHIDLQRIVRGQEINATVAVKLINADTSVGVKAGGTVSQLVSSLDIVCRPRHLPEHIEIDLQNVAIGETIFSSDLVLPEGVRLQHESEEPFAVVQINHPHTEESAD